MKACLVSWMYLMALIVCICITAPFTARSRTYLQVYCYGIEYSNSDDMSFIMAL